MSESLRDQLQRLEATHGKIFPVIEMEDWLTSIVWAPGNLEPEELERIYESSAPTLSALPNLLSFSLMRGFFFFNHQKDI